MDLDIENDEWAQKIACLKTFCWKFNIEIEIEIDPVFLIVEVSLYFSDFIILGTIIFCWKMQKHPQQHCTLCSTKNRYHVYWWFT